MEKKISIFEGGSKRLGKTHKTLFSKARFWFISHEIPNPATANQLTIHVVSVSRQETCQHQQNNVSLNQRRESTVSFINARCSSHIALQGVSVRWGSKPSQSWGSNPGDRP